MPESQRLKETGSSCHLWRQHPTLWNGEVVYAEACQVRFRGALWEACNHQASAELHPDQTIERKKKESIRKNVVINKIPKHTYACAHAHTDGSVLIPFPFDLVLSSGILSLSLVLNPQMSYLAVAPVCLDSSQSFYFEGQVLLGLGTSPRPSFHLELSSCFLAFSGMFFNIQYWLPSAYSLVFHLS